MFTFITEKISELIAAYKKRKEEEEAARKFKNTVTTILVCGGLLCAGYLFFSVRKMINKLFGGE